MTEENKLVGKTYKLNEDFVKIEIFDKEFQMLMKGYIIDYKPKGWFSKLIWKYIRFEVKYKEAPSIWGSLRKVKCPKFKYRISDIN